jgi:superfamily II DNA or RNA helicase
MSNIYIEYDNILAHIDGAVPQDVLALLYEELKYHPDGYEHVYSFQNHHWDGYNRLFNSKDKVFRRGLLNRVVKLLNDAGHTCSIKYAGAKPQLIEHISDFGTIRPYPFQDATVQAGLDNSMGLLVAPCGAGKSVCISKIIAEQKRKTLVILTDIVLLDQMQQVLQRYFNKPIGMIGDGEFDPQDITVSTIQSLLTFTKVPKNIKKAEELKVFKKFAAEITMVIVDEVHLADSASFGEVLPMFRNTDKFLGTSGTPFGWSEKAEKRQNLELEQHFGTVIHDCRKTNFIELGLKVPLHVLVTQREALNKEYNHFMKTIRRHQVPDHGKNYHECLNYELLNNMVASGRSVFVHAPHSIEFGENIAKLIPTAVLVNGKTPRLERRRIYDAMRSRELRVVVSDIGGTGLDLPNLDALILAGDLMDIRQIAGRVERAAPGKTHGTLVDINVNTSFLAKHHRIRRYQYEHAGNIIMET